MRSLRDKIKLGLGFVPGDCNICQQCNVKVRRLRCGKHTYCRMCAEFEPRLSRGDYTCKACAEHRHQKEVNDLDVVDHFLASHTRVTSTIGGAADVSVCGDIDVLTEEDETSENNDLDGNNEEWDHLLQSSVCTAPGPNCSPINHGHTGDPIEAYPERYSKPQFLGIPKKPSFLRIALPAALVDRSTTLSSIGQEVNREISSTVSAFFGADDSLSNQLTSPTSPVRYSRERSISSRNGVQQTDSCWDYTRYIDDDEASVMRFEPDSPEFERGTSHCKGQRSESRSWYNNDVRDPDPSSDSNEMDDLIVDDMERIEGPGFYSSLDCRSRSSSRSSSWMSMTSSSTLNKKTDPFWDI